MYNDPFSLAFFLAMIFPLAMCVTLDFGKGGTSGQIMFVSKKDRDAALTADARRNTPVEDTVADTNEVVEEEIASAA
jgi:hypothetical protein